jgi:hypothetical protein
MRSRRLFAPAVAVVVTLFIYVVGIGATVASSSSAVGGSMTLMLAYVPLFLLGRPWSLLTCGLTAAAGDAPSILTQSALILPTVANLALHIWLHHRRAAKLQPGD